MGVHPHPDGSAPYGVKSGHRSDRCEGVEGLASGEGRLPPTGLGHL
jgi:hypothetical protein